MRNRTLLAGMVITALVLFGVTAGAALSPYSATNMDLLTCCSRRHGRIRSALIRSVATCSRGFWWARGFR